MIRRTGTKSGSGRQHVPPVRCELFARAHREKSSTHAAHLTVKLLVSYRPRPIILWLFPVSLQIWLQSLHTGPYPRRVFSAAP
jgi:hypothetical protein